MKINKQYKNIIQYCCRSNKLKKGMNYMIPNDIKQIIIEKLSVVHIVKYRINFTKNDHYLKVLTMNNFMLINLRYKVYKRVSCSK